MQLDVEHKSKPIPINEIPVNLEERTENARVRKKAILSVLEEEGHRGNKEPEPPPAQERTQAQITKLESQREGREKHKELKKMWKGILADLRTIFEPTYEQMKFAESMFLSEEPMTNSEVAKTIGVPYQRVARWFTDAGFRVFLSHVRMSYLYSHRPKIDAALIKKAEEGNLMAIQTFYSMLGETSITTEDTKMFANISSMDVHEQFMLVMKKVQNIGGVVRDKEAQDIEKTIEHKKLLNAENPDTPTKSDV